MKQDLPPIVYCKLQPSESCHCNEFAPTFDSVTVEQRRRLDLRDKHNDPYAMNGLCSELIDSKPMCRRCIQLKFLQKSN